ncbi:hypothetical protein [Dasania marina]|uniref:hypothetical protein n=1 Tax=Dasania marina TaxID=471499 RepID=UPI00035E82A9|nr:hypothetical protein [Dasania marina]
MSVSPITCIINGNVYKLTAHDSLPVQQMPAADRQQLLSVLALVQRCEQQSKVAVQQAVQVASGQGSASTTSTASAKPERLGSGDVDALMARLIQEEQQNKKPALSKQRLLRNVLLTIAVIIVLTLIF